MRTLLLVAGVVALAAQNAWAAAPCPDLLNHQMTKLRSDERIDFCQAFQGKVILAVNTASNCGFTPQFAGLEALYKKYQGQGLVVLGFPSNDFRQEFDNPEKTARVCYLNYGVSFPMFQTSAVTGPSANPFFQHLIKATGQQPKWNFYKYLISPDANKIEAFASNVTPEQLDAKIQAELAAMANKP